MKSQAMKWVLRAGAAACVAVAGLAMAAPSKPTQGEVRKIDPNAARVTLKHGPIAELELPAITLVYVVREPGQLAGIQPGDKVTFTADRVDGEYTILSISK